MPRILQGTPEFFTFALIMTVTLQNHLLSVDISTLGAELQSIKSLATGHEYLWQGNPRWWARRSPVLFPIVGSLSQGTFHLDGHPYTMSQHGFARDTEFTPISDAPADEAWFALEADARTLSLYPRRFRLETGYRLHEARLQVMWRVTNLDTRPMPFQIGAHPAFNLPGFDPQAPLHGYFAFDRPGPLQSSVIAHKGCIGTHTATITTDAEAMLPICADTFSRDAIILEQTGVHRVSLLDTHRHPYLTLLFDSPLVGLWSPSGAECPFVCIEPWWGRADAVGFSGDFARRPYVNTLQPSQTFTASYLIIIDNI